MDEIVDLISCRDCRIHFLQSGPHGFYPMISSLVASGTPVLQGITFATEPGRVYLPVAEVAAALGSIETSESQRRSLVDGTALIRLSDLRKLGVERGEAALLQSLQ